LLGWFAGVVGVLSGAFAGAGAGLVAESALHPFDTISTRLKAQVASPPKYTGFIHAIKTIVAEGDHATI
jgi:hypothetical protein